MAMPLFDDFLYDVPTRPSLRIAPLQGPLPAPSSASTRPSPLEPSALISVDNESNRLTGRRKALAHAKPLDDIDPNEWEISAITKTNEGLESQEVDDLLGRPKKKQKLYDQDQMAEFVQLPKPATKAKENKPRPFRPVSVLNELHEPPPSAALFPPITPNATQEEQASIAYKDQISTAKTEKRQEPSKRKKTRERPRSTSPVMRTYTRGRTKWTEEEIEYLVKGVTIYGTGRWKSILEHPGLHFKEGRTPTDLKDRFRVCFPPDKPHKWVRPKPEKIEEAVPIVPNEPPQKDKRPRKRARKRHWTEEEDEELVKGFRKYGFDWARIIKDPELHFDNRSSGQVRDRFRLKFKEKYAEEARPPANPVAKAKSRTQESSERRIEKRSDLTARGDGVGDETAARGKTMSKDLAMPSAGGLVTGDDDDNRLSNSILHAGWGLDDGDVTLAPVLPGLWEDMAPKPLFPFD